MTPDAEPLWSDEELALLYLPVEDSNGFLRHPSLMSMFRQICARYDAQLTAVQADVTRLEAELKAERVKTQWQPLPEGEYVDVTISLRTVRFEGRRLNRQPMPEEYAFCCKVTEANGVDQP